MVAGTIAAISGGRLVAGSFSITGLGLKKLQMLAKQLDAKCKSEAAKELNAALEEEIGTIVKRTQSGIDMNGGMFAPYAKNYAKYKAVNRKRGYSNPDLTLTGKMLAGIRARVEPQSWGLLGKLFFTSGQAQKAGWNQKSRPFFGLDKAQLQRIYERMRKVFRL